jgi:tellurite resistance protein TerC
MTTLPIPVTAHDWSGFICVVLTLLIFDLFVFHRNVRAIKMREAAVTSLGWVLISVAFGFLIFLWQGDDKAYEFFSGYIIEKSLSVDNIFLFVVIFNYFRVPPGYQHRVLFWGIMGALIMRGVMIGLGAWLVVRFSWVLYVFGLFLLLTGIKMFFKGDENVDIAKNPFLRFSRRYLPFSQEYEGTRFVVRHKGKLLLTPLMLVLIVIEGTDLLFAVDSIPAVFAVTQDPFIVYTSNVFAILGLRAMYFLLANAVEEFVFLRYGLALILSLVGVKMLVKEIFHVKPAHSLIAILTILTITIVASLYYRARQKNGA